MSSGTVLTIATPDYLARWRFCIRSQQSYCRAHDFDHVVHTGTLPGLHPKWSKLQYTLDALASGRPVLLIDADAEITAEAPPFTNLLSAHPDGDILFTKGVSGRLNSGVMVFRPGEASLASGYLRQCLLERGEAVAPENFVTSEGENGHLIQMIGREPFAGRGVVIDRAWNCTSPDCYGASYIRHYTGPLRRAAEQGTLTPAPRGFVKTSGLRARLRRLLGVLR